MRGKGRAHQPKDKETVCYDDSRPIFRRGLDEDAGLVALPEPLRKAASVRPDPPLHELPGVILGIKSDGSC